MFTNLIESQSHAREFKRRSSFFLITVAAYAIALTGDGVASVLAYDAQLEAQTSNLALMSWVPAVKSDPPRPINEPRPAALRRSPPSSAPVDQTARVQERTAGYLPVSDVLKMPDTINTRGVDVPPVTDPSFIIGRRNVDPPSTVVPNTDGCITCSPKQTVIAITEKPPTPEPPKPKTERLPSSVLVSKALSLPQPAYPAMARQIRVEGAVNIQILVDEQGKVISAQSVSGHPLLTTAAKEAAMRARFTPTVLNGVPVKIQGVITYNFRLQ